MHCEVCGRRIIGSPYRAVIEGAKMTVCSRCARLGSAAWEVEPKRKSKASAKPPSKVLSRLSTRGSTPPTVTTDLELIADYSARVRRARESLGLTHKELGRKTKEKVSVIRKIETAKMVPNHQVAQKLEHALKIRLLVPPSEPKAPLPVTPRPREITLGDMIQVKEKRAEAGKEREQ